MDKILITGASGGLGAAIALHYAMPGHSLLLWGRDHARLESLARACRRKGAQTAIRSLNFTDVDTAVAAMDAADDEGPITLALLVAGIGDIRSTGDTVETPDLVWRLGLVNFVAPCAMASALAKRMIERGSGNIVFIGSAAAFHALPFAASYAASKAGLARFANALRLNLAGHGIRVTLVSPGFIDTPAGARISGPRPLLMQPAYVAKRIARAVDRGQAHLILPWPFAWLRVLDRILPPALRDRLLISLTPGKN